MSYEACQREWPIRCGGAPCSDDRLLRLYSRTHVNITDRHLLKVESGLYSPTVVGIRGHSRIKVWVSMYYQYFGENCNGDATNSEAHGGNVRFQPTPLDERRLV